MVATMNESADSGRVWWTDGLDGRGRWVPGWDATCRRCSRSYMGSALDLCYCDECRSDLWALNE
jgi:hypothetical protein